MAATVPPTGRAVFEVTVIAGRRVTPETECPCGARWQVRAGRAACCRIGHGHMPEVIAREIRVVFVGTAGEGDGDGEGKE